MNNPPAYPDTLRRRVIILFFGGLLLVFLAMGIGRVFPQTWRFDLGWLNLAAGLPLTLAGLPLAGLVGPGAVHPGKGTPAPAVATQRLVTGGPYACTHNPMTLGALGLTLGLGIWTGSGVLVLLTGLVFSGPCYSD